MLLYCARVNLNYFSIATTIFNDVLPYVSKTNKNIEKLKKLKLHCFKKKEKNTIILGVKKENSYNKISLFAAT